jgi:acetyl esterase/lipase
MSRSSSVIMDDDEELKLKRLDSGKLAKHLYARHKTEFWAYLNLGLSSLAMLTFGRSTHAPSLVSIPFGMIGSELTHVVIVLHALNLRRIYKYHPAVFQGWFGKMAILINSWSFGVLLHNMWEALGTRQTFSRSLEAQGITPRAGGSTARWNYVLSLIPLFVVSRRGKQLSIQRNLRYADMQMADPSLLSMWKRTPPRLRNLHMLLCRGRISNWMSLDVYKPESLPTDGPAPILMYIHGGAWMLCDKSFSGHSTATRVASRGVIVAMINYRMAPECVWPDHIIDCKRALAFIKRHAREWGGHPDRVFVSGESAGGHLSALVGASPNFPDFQPPENPTVDTSVAGCLPIYGVFDVTDQNGHLKAIRSTIFDLKVGVRGFFSRVVAQSPITAETMHTFHAASPTWHVQRALKGEADNRVCPYFMSHGTLDMLAAYNDSKEFYDELQKVRAKYGSWAMGESDVFVEVSSGLHGFGYFPSPRAHALGDAMADFIFHHARRLDKTQVPKFES